jgi:hypothetical protein
MCLSADRSSEESGTKSGSYTMRNCIQSSAQARMAMQPCSKFLIKFAEQRRALAIAIAACAAHGTPPAAVSNLRKRAVYVNAHVRMIPIIDPDLRPG